MERKRVSNPKGLLIELIKAYRREGYEIFHVVEGSTGVGILIYKDPKEDPDALIHITNEGWTYYIRVDGKLYKYGSVEMEIENPKALAFEILQ